MKFFFAFIFLQVSIVHSLSQTSATDSLRSALKNAAADTDYIVTLYSLSLAYQDSRPDSALYFAQQAYTLSTKIKFLKGESWSLNQMAFALNSIGDFPKALEYYIQQLRIEEKRGYPDNIVRVYLNIALLYESSKDYDKAIEFAKKADAIIKANNFEELSLFSLLDIGEIYEKKNILDTALEYTKKCYDKSVKAGNNLIAGNALNNLGNIYYKSGHFAEALNSYKQALPVLKASGDYNNYAESTLGLAKIFGQDDQIDSAIFYSKKSFDTARTKNFLLKALDASAYLARLYKKNNNRDSALAYLETSINLKDSFNSREKINQFQSIVFAEQSRARELKEEKIHEQAAIKIYALLAGIALFTVVAFLLLRINRIRKKTNVTLKQQRNELQLALQQLKDTQAQLIQSEKMASLGELTAGVAHEIQNPLNFVNNFSEVNGDLIQEMKEEIDKGNMDEVKLIANDIANNGEKINHHGKRADAIIKKMLQHSQKNAGNKELTDINMLAEEYLKMSYNGIRGRDKSFYAKWQTNFDKNIGKINIAPQDIGRVLMNIYNNAFYTVNEKKKQNNNGYEPELLISTKKINNKPDSYRVEIITEDNGNGIPEKVINKIFQPFFTTKPTSEAAGLGLSLSYDIIKSYGGNIDVETEEGKGSKFILSLPV